MIDRDEDGRPPEFQERKIRRLFWIIVISCAFSLLFNLIDLIKRGAL